MQYIGFLEAAEKHISANTFKENRHTSVKILQIQCNDLCRTLQICTDSQRSKTWTVATEIRSKITEKPGLRFKITEKTTGKRYKNYRNVTKIRYEITDIKTPD